MDIMGETLCFTPLHEHSCMVRRIVVCEPGDLNPPVRLTKQEYRPPQGDVWEGDPDSSEQMYNPEYPIITLYSPIYPCITLNIP